MSVCCVKSCTNNYNKNRNLHFYRFPLYNRNDAPEKQFAILQQRMAWINAVKGKSSVTIGNVHKKKICSAHFVSGEKAGCMDIESEDWIPSLGLPDHVNNENDYPNSIPSNENDYPDSMPNAQSQWDKLEFDHTVIDKETSEIKEIHSSMVNSDETMNLTHSKMPKSMSKESAQYIATLRTTILAQGQIIEELKAKLRYYQFDLESFRNNDTKTRYYTGIPEFSTLETLFNELEPYIKRANHSSLSKSQMFILTLMKLRLGLHFFDLGYRFDVSYVTASRIFYAMIDVLYYRIGNLVFVPNRADVKLTMPIVFKRNFNDDVVYIIDCTEIFVEVPSNPETSVQCWSSYKKHHTVKFLIVISTQAQGAIVFISCLFGGRASDVHITNNCGFFNILLPNDYVLADKGFRLEDSFQMQQAHLVMPAFVYKEQQLHPLEVENNRKIANVRIHVERVIGLLKRKYLMLHNIIPMSMLSKNWSDGTCTLDKIIRVCCALCNLCPPIVHNISSDDDDDTSPL